ncbi:hypothetical protein [Vibrio cholerae]|uniref:hypothetical protein n=1 Tax=Vibrio cholerae TaxID=666 RepID=UPI0011D9BE5F|nr:hypothetical protein [Vibrio cholerae]EKO3695086.1 hypothetical protein [Vibrio metschnikovii]EKO3774840.1 hypothetical protein [Vibrio metschnikovii]TXZ61768.1 hypothetical protein FXE23_05480 [Vibrio cholerae]GIC06444.1 hypothetical protein VCSRO50_3428 [Vibrio cholerae]
MNKFNLVENASDSLKHALRHMGPLEEHGLGNWKRVISDLSHVVELLFKERLRRIHPAFLFTNIDKYPSHNIHTVSAELACKRLQKIGGIDFSEEDLKAIQVAREKRNEIEHYEFAISDHEAKALVGQVTLFIFKFSEEHLGLDWKEEHLQGNQVLLLYTYTEFYAKYLQAALDKINEDQTPVIKCPSCYNMSFDIENEVCLVCNHKEQLLDCSRCNSPYLFSSCEYPEEAELCPECEWQDGYAAYNCEKY